MESDMEASLRPFRPVKPGAIFQEELDARGWTRADLADIIERPASVTDDILTGKTAITPEIALACSSTLLTSPEYWLNLEYAYRLDLLQARRPSTER